jgi:hypothetical protein
MVVAISGCIGPIVATTSRMRVSMTRWMDGSLWMAGMMEDEAGLSVRTWSLTHPEESPDFLHASPDERVGRERSVFRPHL